MNARTNQESPYQGRLLIDGQWCDAADGARLERRSPAHDQLVAVYAQAGVQDAQRAVAAARRAFDQGPWPQMKGAERARILRLVADTILARKQALARMESLENGKPLAQSLAEIEGAADLWQYAASLARTLHGDSYNTLGQATLGVVLREPIGVVGIITPWNFPFLIVSQKLPFALAAGCTCVVKPAEVTSGTTLMLGEILLEAGVPAGAVNMLVGEGSVVGEALVTHPDVDMLSFTGSTAVGKQALAQSAATLKKVALELGGKNPQIIFADCDWEAAVDAVVYGVFFNAGQCCNSGSRILVQDAIAEKFSAAVVERSRHVRVGDPFAEGTQVGAITTHKQLASILAHIEGARRDGAQLALGGARMNRPGLYIEPTVLTGVTRDMAIAKQEVFGPVLSVLRFGTLAEAIELANSTLYGLSAAVWSRDFDTCLTAARRIRAGTVWVNTFLEGHAELPFGGYRESGIGRELGRLATEDYTETKTLHMHLGARADWYLAQA
ncbi:aldehyde dehydrogenase family protein [Verminephrobacter aporrectodeae]|uniref:aldehyde dehydrogenase family protein n=1 Tax=Verminephrobacter aporrectodeae TaxID=1110389 RepID=UPI0022446458|nr:aldehyde dehydrogenase family protein [Verminephrobacter aporrectodeae]MCW8174535.1 aldehyde dehydrogenase family protein [Verminephrobacter aporrectodeae subsp. tuberculatae]MCW8202173.1 aldehyde dehydrogenase family protein [Verminephrobacter aporrectodeae subsp. tuberculatae]MCW8206204.1 aldehyde dehydrogenase family protein [Verminephrobacter aporrectodeae subsp. tuberculatae]